MHWDRLPKNQPAEITMFQISEVQEAPAFNRRRSFLTLRAEITMFQISEVQESPAFNGGRSFLTLRALAMETAQRCDRLAKNQPAEIAMFQISEVQEAPAFNGRRSFLTLRESQTVKITAGDFKFRPACGG
jgi:hypothetical protein